MPNGTLGIGSNKAVIYARGGTDRLLPLTGVVNLTWGRRRNAISEATVTVGIAAADKACRGQLGDVHAWAHELVIFRDGRRVWEGPIYRPELKAASVTFKAWDVLGWLRRRAIRAARVTTTAAKGTVEAGLILDAAFSVGDPNVNAHRQSFTTVSEQTLLRDVQAWSGYYSDDLDSLVGSGLCYTALGRSIITWPVEYTPSFGRTATLDLDRDTSVDLTLIEDGEAATTYGIATGDDETVATSVGDHSYYGRLDTITSVSGVSSLTPYANRVRKDNYPAPQLIDLPGDAPLNARTPITIEQLVPGVIIPVVSNKLLRAVSATTVLDTLNVAVANDGTEKVSVTLIPTPDLS